MDSAVRIKSKITLKTQASANRPHTMTSSLLATIIKSTQAGTKMITSQKRKKSFTNIVSKLPPTKMHRDKHTEAQKDKEIQYQFMEYQRKLQQQHKKQETTTKYLGHKEARNSKRYISKSVIRDRSSVSPARLFVQEFNKFQELKQTGCSKDWEQILLNASKQKQEETRQQRLKKYEPYQRLINKLKFLNNQNYDYENIKGINYCRGVKHQITRSRSHIHPRSRSEHKTDNRQSSNTRIGNYLKQTVVQSTKSILRMCTEYKELAKNCKEDLDGFQIYCSQFAHILNKKKAVLHAFQGQVV